MSTQAARFPVSAARRTALRPRAVRIPPGRRTRASAPSPARCSRSTPGQRSVSGRGPRADRATRPKFIAAQHSAGRLCAARRCVSRASACLAPGAVPMIRHAAAPGCRCCQSWSVNRQRLANHAVAALVSIARRHRRCGGHRAPVSNTGWQGAARPPWTTSHEWLADLNRVPRRRRRTQPRASRRREPSTALGKPSVSAERSSGGRGCIRPGAERRPRPGRRNGSGRRSCAGAVARRAPASSAWSGRPATGRARDSRFRESGRLTLSLVLTRAVGAVYWKIGSVAVPCA